MLLEFEVVVSMSILIRVVLDAGKEEGEGRVMVVVILCVQSKMRVLRIFREGGVDAWAS